MIERQEIQELFPTPLWIVDLLPATAAVLNAKLKAEIERLIEPRPTIPVGRNWQTPQDLHTRPAFSEFVKLVETAARGVARFLHVDQYPMAITGCWANVLAPGGAHRAHSHPNNYLSGVYYLSTHRGADTIAFHDPRRQTYVMRAPVTELTAQNTDQVVVEVADGTLLVFPSWLEHSVDANRSEAERISLSFNLMFADFAGKLSSPLW